jgi:hypothetical protein
VVTDVVGAIATAIPVPGRTHQQPPGHFLVRTAGPPAELTRNMRSSRGGYPASMNRVTARHLAPVLLAAAALALAGCSSATNDQPSQETTTTTTETATSPALRPECEQVADKGRDLLAEVGRFTTQDATVADVQAAAAELSDAFDNAKAALGPEAQGKLDNAEQVLAQVQDALAAQPVDTAALRRAAADLVATAGDAATLCSPSSATGEATTTDDTETTTDTTTDTETTTP